MFAEGIAFVCFYEAERVLSAITTALVHLLGEGERRLEGEGRGSEEGKLVIS